MVNAVVSFGPLLGALEVPTAEITVETTGTGISQTWFDHAGQTWRRTYAAGEWTPWAIQSLRPDFADFVTTLNSQTPVAQRSLDVWVTTGRQVVIAPGTSISAAPAMARFDAGARFWTAREGDALIQHLEAGGRSWSRRYVDGAFGVWKSALPPPADLALTAALQAAHQAGTAGLDSAALRDQIVQAGAFYIGLNSAPPGPVEALTAGGHWAVPLIRAGTEAPLMGTDGLVFGGAGHLERLSSAPIVDHAASQLDIYLDFTISAVGSGSQTILELSNDADRRFKVALLSSGSDYCRLRFELPAGVSFLDPDHHYPLGDRIRLVVGLDYARGRALIAQTPWPIALNFTPPSAGSLHPKRVILGSLSSLILHEALILTRGEHQ